MDKAIITVQIIVSNKVKLLGRLERFFQIEISKNKLTRIKVTKIGRNT